LSARRAIAGCAAALGWIAASPAAAGLADVVSASAQCAGETCDFTASVRHADAGWSHYADRFEVVAPDGAVLATRVLRHPHVQEQPVTRSLAGVRIPEGIARVVVRAHDSEHGYGGAEVEVALDRAQ
jgi:hypothetical protein